ncbi:DUF4097 domain-containing protein [Salinirubellus sp. GCM10025818]|uniref:DUF4097 family beta strand repeat-containing protein n=1 Tax=Salinirubellus TaxID=2162630 RepID=UPI0030D493AD
MDAPSSPADPSGPAATTRRRLLAVGATAAAGLAGCVGFAGPDVTESSSRTFDAPEGVVSIENRNGDVEVGPHDDGDSEGVVVEIRKRGRSQAAIDAVAVEGATEEGDLVVRTMYDDRLRNASVDLSVRVPEGTAVGSVETRNGDAVVRSVSGDVRATTSNGDARAVDVDGYVTVRSSNGDAEARGTTGLAGARSANGDVRVEVYDLRGATDATSANGDVEAGVAPGLDATVLATAGNGDLDVEVELDDASVSTRQARGRLGDGGPLLTLTSANGDVRLYGLAD